MFWGSHGPSQYPVGFRTQHCWMAFGPGVMAQGPTFRPVPHRLPAQVHKRWDQALSATLLCPPTRPSKPVTGTYDLTGQYAAFIQVKFSRCTSGTPAGGTICGNGLD